MTSSNTTRWVPWPQVVAALLAAVASLVVYIWQANLKRLDAVEDRQRAVDVANAMQDAEIGFLKRQHEEDTEAIRRIDEALRRPRR